MDQRKPKESRLSIVPAVGGKLLSAWIRFPYSIYSKDSCWVAPIEADIKRKLSEKKNPFLKNGAALPLLAIDDNGQIKGRILAHVDFKMMARLPDDAGYFGYFECIDDANVARSLFYEAEAFAKSHGCERLCGPYNMNAYQEMGIVLEGFDNPLNVADTMTAPYYPSLLNSAGFKIIKKISTYINKSLSRLDPEVLLTRNARILLKSRKLKFMKIKKRNFYRELEAFRDIYNECFLTNWRYIPRTSEELRFEMGQAKSVLRPEMLTIAMLHDVPVGFCIALPNIYPLIKPLKGKLSLLKVSSVIRGIGKMKEAQLMSIGVVPSLRRKGILSLILYHTICTLKKMGFESVSTTWASDENAASMAVIKAMNMKRKHRLAIYEKRF